MLSVFFVPCTQKPLRSPSGFKHLLLNLIVLDKIKHNPLLQIGSFVSRTQLVMHQVPLQERSKYCINHFYCWLTPRNGYFNELFNQHRQVDYSVFLDQSFTLECCLSFWVQCYNSVLELSSLIPCFVCTSQSNLFFASALWLLASVQFHLDALD